MVVTHVVSNFLQLALYDNRLGFRPHYAEGQDGQLLARIDGLWLRWTLVCMPRSFQTSIMMPAVKCVHWSELTLVWDMLLGYFTDLVNLQTRVRAHLLPLVDHWSNPIYLEV